MGFKVVVTSTAAREVAEAIAYLRAFSHQAAVSFERDYRSVLENIRDGVVEYRHARVRELALKGYKTAFFNRYMLIYKVRGETAFIMHVFHQSQDYARFV